MVFSGAMFLFAFLPLLLGVYYVIPRRCMAARNGALLGASLLFYAFGEPVWVVLLILSAASDYVCGRVIGWRRARGTGPRSGKAALIVSLCLNLGLLATFKYLDFFLDSAGLLLGRGLPLTGLALPIGISFYTFQTLSYTLDVYRGKVGVQRSFLDFLLYVSLFPQLIAGPIVRYSAIESQLRGRRADWDTFSRGVQRFIVGLSKKMLLANPLGAIAADTFAADALTLSPGLAWLGALCFTFQIYYDFSGYSDMAIGLGLMFGFRFDENFRHPYAARSVRDFWTRWHISLSSWFRDYVYIPLGGNRRGRGRQIFNIMLVWGLTGLWHGAAWNFVLWGLYYGVLLLLEKFVWGKALERAPRALGHVYTLLITVFGWVIFNAGSLPQIGQYTAAMLGAGSGYYSGALRRLLDYKAELLCACAFSVPLAAGLRGLPRKLTEPSPRLTAAAEALRLAGLLALFALSAVSVVKSSYNPFLYFRF